MVNIRSRWLNYPLKKIPLRLVLVIPFVLQTVGIVGLVGYLSVQSGQKAVENLANQMMKEVGERINDRLTHYLHLPHEIVAAKNLAVKQGTLNPQNFEQIREQLWQQMILNPSLATNYFWSERGEAIGYGRILTEEFRQKAEKLTGERLSIGTLFFMQVSQDNLNLRQFFLVNNQGKPKKLVYTLPDNFRQLPWYNHAKKVGKQSWTGIFTYYAIPILGMQATVPVYQADRQLQGVFTSSFSLSNISKFLNQLNFSPTGQAFIIERSGELVATSTLEIPAIQQKKSQKKRLTAVNSQDEKTQAIAQQLRKKFGNYDTWKTAQKLSLIYQNKRQFIRIVPYRDNYGLDWLVIIIVPESDFMAEIHANTRNTVLLSISALGIAIALGIFTANQITKRIYQINQASQAMASGYLKQRLPTESRVKELGELAESFNKMAAQLRQSFNRIQTALLDSKEKFTTIFRVSPDPIAILTLAEGRIIEINNRCIDFFGYSREECIGFTVLELGLWSNLAEREKFKQLLQKTGNIYNLEVDINLKSRETKTVLISAEICNLEEQDCMIVMIKDISERKQIEAALHQSEAQLELFFSQSLDGFFFMMLEQPVQWDDTVDKEQVLDYVFAHQKVTKVNDAMLEQYLATREQFIGLTPNDFFTHNINQGREVWRKLFDAGKLHIETDERRFDGSQIWIEGYYICLYNDQGKITGHFGVQRDVSEREAALRERKLAEIALRESEERFRNLFENSPVAYQSLDEQGRFIDVNSQLCDLLAYSREELIGKSFGDFWTKETKSLFPKRFACFKSDGSTHYELQLIRKDEVKIIALLEGRVQYNSQGEFLKTHCILYNITERKEIEKALRLTRAKLLQANRNLEKLVNIDSLTQVPNRRRFDDYLQKEWRRALREQNFLSLIMFDVDYFKLYNDHYGHQEGDECLIKIAQAVQQVLYRPTDLIAR
jgi:PAS domain S-box-containing protein